MRYRKQLAAVHDPDERAAGLKEWGTGEVRIDDVALLGAGGESRTQFLSGESLTLRLRLVAEQPVPPPRLSYELRDSSGLLLAGATQPTAELGWTDESSELPIRFEIDELPLADGRFHLRLGLADESGERLYHSIDDAAIFVVVPGGEERGAVRVEGRWAREEIEAQAERVGGR